MLVPLSSNRADTALLTCLNENYFLIDFSLDGDRLLSANAAFLAETGYSLPELRRLPIADLFPQAADAIAAAARGKVPQAAELTCRTRSGAAFQIYASFMPVRMRRHPGKIVLIGSRLATSAGRTGDVIIQTLEQTIDAVVTIDQNNCITFFNAAAEQLWGIAREEVLGINVSILVPPELRDQHDGFIGRHRRTGENRIVGGTRDVPIYRKDGQKLWGSLSISQIVLEDGRKLYTAFLKNVTAEVRRREETERVGRLVEANLAQIAEAIGGIIQRTASVTATMTQTAATTHTVAGSAGEISQSIADISGGIEASKQAVDDAARHVYDAGGEAARLRQAATSMTSIVEFIQRIASNINLLALNATIESARAGEAGRGFAIVASEVKGLARQVAEATESISREIADVQAIAAHVVSMLSDVETAMNRIQGGVTDIAAALGHQTSATREISVNMQGTSGVIGTAEENIRGILGAAEAAGGLSEESERLYAALRAAV